MNQLATISTSAAVALRHAVPLAASTEASSSELPTRASARRPKKSAGSARQANGSSRAAPIPSHEDPVSSAAAVVNKRPRPERQKKRIMAPREPIGAMPVQGRNNDDAPATTT